MGALSPPRSRTCRDCGRSERYDESVGAWRVADDPGRPFCLHVWDITGEFSP